MNYNCTDMCTLLPQSYSVFFLQGHIKYENSTTMPDNFLTSKVSEMKHLEKKLIEGSFL